MGHDTQVEVDDVDWFHGYGPIPMTDRECVHECEHWDRRTIAWGPTLVHYELMRCDNCMCRAWHAALPGSHGPIDDSHPWLLPVVPEAPQFPR